MLLQKALTFSYLIFFHSWNSKWNYLIRISVNGLEAPLNKLSASKCDNYNINYLGKSAEIVQNFNDDSSSRPGFLDEEKEKSLQL